jgi:hypothetical protein
MVACVCICPDDWQEAEACLQRRLQLVHVISMPKEHAWLVCICMLVAQATPGAGITTPAVIPSRLVLKLSVCLCCIAGEHTSRN